VAGLVSDLESNAAGETELQAFEGRQTLRLFHLGDERFALFAGEVDGVVRWQRPTPLPGAPQPVLGVVSAHARMVTVLNTARLLAMPLLDNSAAPGCIIVLRGPAQLGLTATAEGGTSEISASDLETVPESDARPLLGFVDHGNEKILVLDPQRLFSAAMRGRQRRRRQL